MGWDVSVDDSIGVVTLRMDGPDTREDRNAARRDVGEVLRITGYLLCLIDLRGITADSVVTQVEGVEFGDSFRAEAGLWRNITMAVVMPADPQARVPTRITTQSIANRGVNLQMFDRIAEAYRWLAAEHSLRGRRHSSIRRP